MTPRRAAVSAEPVRLGAILKKQLRGSRVSASAEAWDNKTGLSNSAGISSPTGGFAPLHSLQPLIMTLLATVPNPLERPCNPRLFP